MIGYASGKTPRLHTNRLLFENIAIARLCWGQYRMGNLERIASTQIALYEMYFKGDLQPVICERFPLENLPNALDAISKRRIYRKVVVDSI